MKMHTFFLSGKAVVIVSGALGACGALLFVSGVLVGVRVTSPLPARPVAVAIPQVEVKRAPAGASASEAPAAGATTTATASPGNNVVDAGPSAPASAAWPFNSASYSPAYVPERSTEPMIPAAVSPAPVPAPAAPTVPEPARRGTTGRVSMIAYVPSSAQTPDAPAEPATPAARDNGEYLVQVGTFRVEQHARELAQRLTNAGYRATVTVRQEGDKSLHVVRVGHFTGLETAERVAAKIGGSEQLVASVVASRN